MKKMTFRLLCLLLLPAAALADGVIYVSDQERGVLRIDLAADPIKPQLLAMPETGPRGLALSDDGRWLFTANLKTRDMAVIDTQAWSIVRRIPIGANPEFLRILKGRAYISYEPSSPGGPPKAHGNTQADDDDDKQPSRVAVVDVASGRLVRSLSAALETEGIEFSADGRQLVVTNEGEDTLAMYATASGKKLRTVALGEYGKRPRGIKRSPDGQRYVVSLENSAKLLLLDRQLRPLRTVDTAEGPYGVAFDRSGQRIVVATGRGKRLQVFDSNTLERLADIPVGQRCWHFSFTPDERELLLACGRSAQVLRIDMQSYRVSGEIADLGLPWGVVAWPRSSGSLDEPARPTPGKAKP